MKATIRQTFMFDTGGIYVLSFLAAAREGTYAHHDFSVTFDGVVVGYVCTTDAAFRRYRFRLPYAKTGMPHTLAFEGINHGDDIDRASFLDSVILVKTDAVAPDADAFAQTEINLSTNTWLDLDYDGLVTMNRVAYNKKSFTGLLNATNTPFIRGTGCIYAARKGALFSVR